jgi:succinate dehydrogenase/fumarate reductase cytochrome b subunit
MTLRRAHLLTACLLLLFLAAHLANHMMAIAGTGRHIAVMEALRAIYRHPLVEPALLGAFALQAFLGLRLLWRSRGAPSHPVATLRKLSGAYLAFFLLVHVGAVLAGRYWLGLDTNFWFAAAGYQAGAMIFWFVPYYFLAVLALFMHLGCAAYWISGGAGARSRSLLAGIAGAGFVISGLISAALLGAFEVFEVPARYLATYGVSK